VSLVCAAGERECVTVGSRGADGSSGRTAHVDQSEAAAERAEQSDTITPVSVPVFNT